MAIDIGRRQFISSLGGAAVAWPRTAATEQSDRAKRIGALIAVSENDPQSRRCVTSFEEGMEKLGWTVGRNLRIEYRFGISDLASAQPAAAEMLALTPDLILAHAVPAVRAALQATRTVPIVFIGISEPVALGFVVSLPHPDGNATGFTNLEPTVGGKWLELLKDIAPNVAHVAFMFNPASSTVLPQFYHAVEAAAPKLAVTTRMAPVREPAEIEAVMTRLASEPGGGLILPVDPFLVSRYKLITELAARNQLPAIAAFSNFVTGGGLMSYGPDVPDEFRRAAVYVDRIFSGQKPGDLAVQQPVKFEMTINLKTAKALGLIVPQTLLVAADEVIE